MKRILFLTALGLSFLNAANHATNYISVNELENALQTRNDKKLIPYDVDVEEYFCVEKSPVEGVCTAVLFLHNKVDSKRVSVSTIPLVRQSGVWTLVDLVEEVEK